MKAFWGVSSSWPALSPHGARHAQPSWTLQVFEQEIDGLAHQLGPAGVLYIGQLIQLDQLALAQMHAHGH
jgi:hypothetical protein